jgi:hypothetical protein
VRRLAQPPTRNINKFFFFSKKNTPMSQQNSYLISLWPGLQAQAKRIRQLEDELHIEKRRLADLARRAHDLSLDASNASRKRMRSHFCSDITQQPPSDPRPAKTNRQSPHHTSATNAINQYMLLQQQQPDDICHQTTSRNQLEEGEIID